MRFFTLILTISLSASLSKPVFAQTKVIDSLKKVYENAENDAVKLNALVSLNILLTDQDEQTDYLTKQLVLATKLQKFEMTAQTLGNLGWHKYSNQEYKSADSLYQKSLEICRKYGYPKQEGSTYMCLMMLNWWQGKTKEGVAYFEKAEKLLQQINANKQLSSLYLNASELYKQINLPDQSIMYGQKSLEFANKSLDTNSIIQSAAFLGDAYTKAGENEKAFTVLKNALVMAQNRNDEYSLGDINYFLSIYYLNKKDYLNAGIYCETAIKYYSKIHANDRVLSAMGSLADIYFLKKDFDKSKKILANQKSLLDPGSNMERYYYRSMANIDLVKQDVNAWEKDNAIADSLENISTGIEVKKAVLEIDIKYKTSLKEKEIVLLNQQKDRQKIFIIGLLGTLTALSVISFFAYRYISQKKFLADQKNIQLEQEKQLVAVSSILEGQEAERSRMAKDLHDGLGGMLSGIKLNLSSMKGNMIIHETDAQLFTKSISQLDSAIAEMRRVAHNMMPEALLKFGLGEAIQDYCDGINESNIVKMKYTQLGLQQPLEKSTEVILYRIVQELCNNAIKHAAAKNIFIQLTKHERGITLTVEDDGKGFDTNLLAKIKGAGLQNVQSRVDYLKGILNIESEAGKGTSVNIEIPL